MRPTLGFKRSLWRPFHCPTLKQTVFPVKWRPKPAGGLISLTGASSVAEGWYGYSSAPQSSIIVNESHSCTGWCIPSLTWTGGALWLWSSLYTSCCKYLPERRMYINPQRKIVPKKTHHLLRNTMSSCLRNWNEWNYVFLTCCDCLLDKLRSLSSRRRVIVPLQDVRTTASSSFPFLLKCKVSLAPCWLSDNH